MKKFRLWLMVVLVVVAVIVVLQNTEDVPTQILFVTLTMPLAVLLFVTLLAGFVVGLLVGAGPFRRTERKTPYEDAADRV